jgi:hypothetical protein
MNFAKGLQKAYEEKWAYINTFTVYLGIVDEDTKKQCGWTDELLRNINLNIVSIDTPQFTNQPIEVFVANQWRIHNGRDELYRFSITFRDKDQLALYRCFVKHYNLTRSDYFDSSKMAIVLSKDADYVDEIEKPLFTFSDTLIESVSQLQFNNTTENQIAEFTVNFKTVIPTII